MCLVLNKNSKELIAETDIVCYKAAYRSFKVGWDYFTTPFQRDYVVKLCNTYNSNIDFGTEYGKRLKNHKRVSKQTIERGLHSYKTRYACIKYNEGNDKISLIKCIIPKGSTYWVGKFQNYDGYASTAIKYLEVFKTGTGL